MGFVKIPGMRGQLYVPPEPGGMRKHLCPDCTSCLMCNDSKCEMCREQRVCEVTRSMEKVPRGEEQE